MKTKMVSGKNWCSMYRHPFRRVGSPEKKRGREMPLTRGREEEMERRGKDPRGGNERERTIATLFQASSDGNDSAQVLSWITSLEHHQNTRREKGTQHIPGSSSERRNGWFWLGSDEEREEKQEEKKDAELMQGEKREENKVHETQISVWNKIWSNWRHLTSSPSNNSNH